MVILKDKGQTPKNIRVAPVNANKIPNTNKNLFIAVIFLLSNYPDPYFILPKNRLLDDFLNFAPQSEAYYNNGVYGDDEGKIGGD